jgi:glycolate oxidase FAD binding subunit
MNNNNSHITETITPADQAAVAEAVRDAGSKGLAVYPIGGSTEKGDILHLCEAPTPRPGIGLSLTSLNRVIDYPADDLTITVEAGLTITELNNCLATHRQRLSIDMPFADRATVGGAVAANAAGPRQYAYGTMRDCLLGFTAVDGTGMTFSGGGRVVKNAAGYNMCRLMAGSFGTLGVITQVTLLVRPLPETSALIACDLPNFDLAEKLLAGLVHSPVHPVAIELLAGRPRQDNPVLGPVLEGCVGRLYVGLEGSAPDVAWMVDQLRSQWNTAGVATPILVSTPASDQQWRWLAESPLETRMTVLPSQTVSKITELLADDPTRTIQAHAGNGVIRTDLPSPRGSGAGSEGKPTSAELRVMQAIKDRFDPHNILTPGRFVYG